MAARTAMGPPDCPFWVPRFAGEGGIHHRFVGESMEGVEETFGRACWSTLVVDEPVDAPRGFDWSTANSWSTPNK